MTEFENTEVGVSRDDAERAVDTHIRLANRALSIARNAPYFQFVSERDYTQVEFDGDDAVLYWPKNVEDGHGWSGIEREELRFPAALLFLSHEEFLKWKQEEIAKYDEKERDRLSAIALQRQAQELATLRALKAKYGE